MKTNFSLQSLAEKVLEIDRVSQVSDIFLFSCFTGMAYADVSKLTRSEIVKGPDSEMWIYAKRKKTDTLTHIPLLLSDLGILMKYADHPVCVNKNTKQLCRLSLVKK
jgi:hypothetical protein